MEAGSRFEIIRVRNFLSHRNGQLTDVDMEVTIRSVAKESKHIVLQLPDFMPNLRIVDSSGEEYPLLPSKHLQIMLREASAAGPDRDAAYATLAEIDDRKARLVWFSIPPGKAFGPNEARVIHLKYEHVEEKAGWIDRMRNMMVRTIIISIPPEQSFPMLWVLDKPPDYNISRRRYSSKEHVKTAGGGSRGDKAGTAVFRDTTKSVSLHVGPSKASAILSYSLVPKKTVLALPASVIGMLTLLAASLGVGPLLDSDNPLWPIAEEILRHETLLVLFIPRRA